MMAACRYLVVVYPLKARQHLTGRATIVSIAAVVVASIVATPPHFVVNSVARCWTIDWQTAGRRWRYEVVPTSVHRSAWFYVRWVWPICSTFVPLAALGAFNVRLVRELNAARRSMGAKASTAAGAGGSAVGNPLRPRVMRNSTTVVADPLRRSDDGLAVVRTTSAGRKVCYAFA